MKLSKNDLIFDCLELPLFLFLIALLCLGCQSQGEGRVEKDGNPKPVDSLIGSEGLFAVSSLPSYIPANGFESPNQHTFQRQPFMLKDKATFATVYMKMQEEEGVKVLLQRVRKDSSLISRIYHSSMFMYLHGDAEWNRRNVLYALICYNDDKGVIYYVCDSDLSDRDAIAAVRTFPTNLIELVMEVDDAKVPSRYQSSTGGYSPAIVSFLTKGEPQVVVEADAIPYHRQPQPWAPDWAARYMPGRKLIDSLIWTLADITCGADS